MREKTAIEIAKEMVEDRFDKAVDFKKYNDPDNNFTISTMRLIPAERTPKSS